MQQQKIRSCHDLSEGGLATAAAEMAFAGGYGLQLDLSSVPVGDDVPAGMSDVAALFAESNSRFLIEVAPDDVAAVEAEMKYVPFAWIGSVNGSDELVVTAGDRSVIRHRLADLKSAWQTPLGWD